MCTYKLADFLEYTAEKYASLAAMCPFSKIAKKLLNHSILHTRTCVLSVHILNKLLGHLWFESLYIIYTRIEFFFFVEGVGETTASTVHI